MSAVLNHMGNLTNKVPIPSLDTLNRTSQWYFWDPLRVPNIMHYTSSWVKILASLPFKEGCADLYLNYVWWVVVVGQPVTDPISG